MVLRKIVRTVLVVALVSLTPAMASKRILVDLTHQIAIAYQDGKVKFYGRISSGKPGHRTPTGTFYVREKDIDHVSNLWPKPNGGAHMPYMLRITHDGVAMHLGPTPDYPASHGCIRMRSGFAQRMYRWADKWIRVDVVGVAPAHSPAVKLPAYARSTKVLRRSLGGFDGNPLHMLSSNPKLHRLDVPIAQKSLRKSRKGTRKKVQLRTRRKRRTHRHHKRGRHHSNPLHAINEH